MYEDDYNEEHNPNSEYYRHENTAPLRQSKFGIASLVLILLVGICMLAIFIYVGFEETNNPGALEKNELKAGIVGLSIIGLGFSTILSLIIGVIGLLRQNRAKLCAILGTLFSAAIFLGTAGLIAIGLMNR